MKELEILLTRFWIIKEMDRELYYKVKNEIGKADKFIKELLGYNLIINEKLIKLEKIPGTPQASLGIEGFNEIMNYEMLCLMLMFLETKDDGDQFLLSEMTEYVEVNGKNDGERGNIDWTKLTHRRSFVKVFKYLESMYLIKVYEGNSDNFLKDSYKEYEGLYENTGLSRYFSVSFPYDITDYERPEDFLAPKDMEFDLDRGTFRSNRVYRRLVLSPSVFFTKFDDPDYAYIKNQRWILDKNMDEYLDARLRVYKNGAFVVFDEDKRTKTHPNNKVISDIVLFLCGKIIKSLEDGMLKKESNDFIYISNNVFESILAMVVEENSHGFSKEYAEMSFKKLYSEVISYMEEWMLGKAQEENILLFPSIGLFYGKYLKNSKGSD